MDDRGMTHQGMAGGVKTPGDTNAMGPFGPAVDRPRASIEGPLPSLAGALAVLEGEIETLEKTLAVHGEEIMERLDPILALIPTDSAAEAAMVGDERQSASIGRVNYLANRVCNATRRLEALHSQLMQRIAL